MIKRKTIEEFKKEIKLLTNDEYILLTDKYINNKTKVTFKHCICKNIFDMRPHDFLRGQRCPKCFGNSKKDSITFNNEIKKLTKNEYCVISDYINNKTKVTFLHKTCNRTFDMTPVCFLTQKQRCPLCSKKHKLTTDEFKEKIFNLVGNEYSVLGEYNGCQIKILMKHNKCNKTFLVRPSHFTDTGTRCPFCKESKGEKKIENWLNKNNIIYSKQFYFEDLFYSDKKHPLKFDFRIECENPNDYILLEFDGEQHSNPNSKFKPYKEDFNNQIKRDKLKDEYCKSHDNIDLYRISYKDFNKIENILEDIIKNYE